MELKNWRLYFPIGFDMQEEQMIVGAFSDYIEGVASAKAFEFSVACAVKGNIFGSKKNKDGTEFCTPPLIRFVRLADKEDQKYDFVIETEGGRYKVKLCEIDPKFRDKIWTFGTPHVDRS
jgi:hypothetical protein